MSNEKDSASKGVSELKPCPFCGSQNVSLSDELDENANWVVWCLDCKSGGTFCEEKSEAIEHWNARVHQPELNLEDKKSGETDDPHPGYDCGNTCVICKDGLRKIRQKASIRSQTAIPESVSLDADLPQSGYYLPSDVHAALLAQLKETLSPPLILEGDNAIDVASWFTERVRAVFALVGGQDSKSALRGHNED